MANIEHPDAQGLLRNDAFSQVVKATGATTVYISGQVSIDEQGELIGAGDLGAQTAQVMHNLGLALQAAGATFDDVVKITTYVVGYRPEQRAVIARERSRLLPQPPPASTLVGVEALADPRWLIEIEAVAVV